MADKKVEVASQGIGFFGLLALLFIGLKLVGVIHWSWWWVTVPLWGGLALVLSIFAAIVVVAGVLAAGGLLFSAIGKLGRGKTPRL